MKKLFKHLEIIMPNQLLIDPTRTTTLRNKFVADMVRRFKAVATAIYQALVDADALGLEPAFQLQLNVDQQIWRFQTDSQKITSYRKWLQGEIDNKVLTVEGLGDPWTNKYVESAYKKGVVRAYTDAHRIDFATTSTVFEQSKAQFLSSTFAASETLSKLELVSLRTFNELQGVTAVMSQQLSRELANGLANGLAPSVIARNMRNNITKITNTRAKVIARTEIIHAHAEGQLDTFEKLGVKELGLMAEWSTAGDERVCFECGELEGVVMTVQEARGLLPRHPNCRCSWIPADLNKKEQGQLWGRNKDIAVEKSIQKEAGKNIKKRSPAAIRRRSVWAGKDLK